MKPIKVLWGLLVDDGRLAFVLVLSLMIGAVLSATGLKTMGAIVIWVGLLLSLLYSVEHQLGLRTRKRRS